MFNRKEQKSSNKCNPRSLHNFKGVTIPLPPIYPRQNGESQYILHYYYASHIQAFQQGKTSTT